MDDSNSQAFNSQTFNPSSRAVACPDCGLIVLCGPDEGHGARYDVQSWKLMCKRPDRQNPLWCFVSRDGTSTLPEREPASAAVVD